MPSIVRVENLTVAYGEKPILKGVTFHVEAASVTTLLGPNGAGKSTCISVLTGLMAPALGKVEVNGHNPRSPKARETFGCTPQDLDFPKTLKVREIIEFVRAHYANPKSLDWLAQTFSLEDDLNRQTGALSGGQKRRLACAIAFAGNCNLIFLDEPTTGLDVQSRARLWSAIQEHAKNGGSVFLTTHYLEEADRLSDRVILLDKGQIKFNGDAKGFRERVNLRRVKLQTMPLPKLENVVRWEVSNGSTYLFTANSDQLVKELVAKNISFRDLEIHPLTIEEAFLMLTENNP